MAFFDLENLEVNIPSMNFGEYCTFLAACPKFGKTEFCTKFDKPLIFDFEKGSAGKVVYRVPISKWSDLKKYVKQLITNSKLKEKYKTICFDTINYALSSCKQYAIDDYQEKNPGKVIDTFNKIPYGGGWELLEKEFKPLINSLKEAGYGVVMVAHIKDKTVDKDLETERTQTVPDLSDKERNMISAMADFLLLGEKELSIIEPAQRDGDKIIKEAVIKEERVLYLRSNRSVEAGFRWEGVPDKIPFSFEELQNVFKGAVQREIEKGKEKFGLTDKKALEIRENLEEIRKEEEKQIFEEDKLPNLIEEIKQLASKLRDGGFAIKDINKMLNGNPDNIKEVEVAESVLNNLKSLER